MALTNFIRETWTAAVAEAFQESAVAAPLLRKQYGGDIERGSKIHLTAVVPPTINDYAATRTTSPEAVADDGDELLIDKAKAFDFKVDDIDKAQAAGNFEAWTMGAGRALAEEIDTDIFTEVKAGGTALSGGTVPTDAASAIEVVRDLRKALSKGKVPAGDRALFVNAEFAALLLSADGILLRADESGTTAGLREASLGRLLGFGVYESENLPVVATPAAYAVWTPAVGFVSQIDEVESMRDNDSFADRVRGLAVYGVQVFSYHSAGVVYLDA